MQCNEQCLLGPIADIDLHGEHQMKTPEHGPGFLNCAVCFLSESVAKTDPNGLNIHVAEGVLGVAIAGNARANQRSPADGDEWA